MSPKFRTIRNKTTEFIKCSKGNYFNKLTETLKSSSKSSKNWWATLNFFIKSSGNSEIPPIQYGNKIIDDAFDKANIFNNVFTSQSNIDHCQIPTLPRVTNRTQSSLSQLILEPYEVDLVLKGLPLGKASGPDGLNNRLLLELSLELSGPLCTLFNYSLRTGFFPSIWEDANVCPIFKSGDPSLVNNYRPISLLNTIGKTFEKIVFKHTFNYLHDYNILTPYQSGFLPCDSTTNQLTYLYNMFAKAVDSGKEVRVVFCDISKAFDRVWHDGLIFKLNEIGISNIMLTWFKSYLSNRRQQVGLPGSCSQWNVVPAGVPQGSILGPLLFLIYINGIVNDICANIRLFADDTSLSIIIENPTLAANTLNDDLQKISVWASKWLVNFNPNKTESLLISRSTHDHAHPTLIMNNTPIKEVSSHKHLGVILTENLN